MVRIAFKSVSKKIFLSFFLLILLGLAAFLYSYLGVLNISETLSNGPASTYKLTLINQTLVKIYESESNARLYSATDDPEYLAAYQQQNQQIDSSLQVLRRISYSSEQQLQLVNILVLQAQKSSLIKELIELKKTKISPSDYSVLFKNRPESLEVEMTQKVYSSANLTAATASPAKKRSFFERLKAVFKDDETHVSAQSNIGLQRKIDSATFNQKRRDNNFADVKRQIATLRAKESKLANELAEQEVDLLKKDKLLTDRMLFQITKLSHEEININKKQLERFEAASKEYSGRFLLLGLSSVFVVLIFIFLIARDIRANSKMQVQLEESNEKIQELLKVKERFLANMSHEIRTPLSAIVGFSELLLKKKKYSEEETSAINSSAKHLHSIVNEILDYSKVESNNVQLDNTIFNLGELVREVSSEMLIKANEKGIRLKNSVGDIPASVCMDRLRLKQVMLNLMSNAIKFTDKGDVAINAYRKEGQLYIEVVDTGIGIPEHAQKKIFDEFTQADGTVARKFGGTGLGLSISRKLVVLMGGGMELYSKENVGSTFTISFNIDDIVSDNQVVDMCSKQEQLVKPHKVLFIDDDDFVRLLIRKLLESNDIKYDEAESGSVGVEKSRLGVYDLIITDLHMPGMSGIDTVKVIREFNPSAKILFLSADFSQSMVAEMKSIGASGILQKPFSENELLTAISGIMKEGRCVDGNASEKHFDVSKVIAFVGDDKTELGLIVSTFITSADEAIGFIVSSKAKSDGIAVADKAHKLLTGFRQFGISKGVELLRKIEKCREGERLSAVQKDIEKLDALWKEVREQLSKYA